MRLSFIETGYRQTLAEEIDTAALEEETAGAHPRYIAVMHNVLSSSLHEAQTLRDDIEALHQDHIEHDTPQFCEQATRLFTDLIMQLETLIERQANSLRTILKAGTAISEVKIQDIFAAGIFTTLEEWQP